MKMFAFSVRDEAVEAFLPPFFCRSRGEGMRSFKDAVGNRDTAFCKNPHDFVLYSVGQFDDVAGSFVATEPERIMSALECMDVYVDDERRVERAG